VIVWEQEGFGAGEQLEAALARLFGQGESPGESEGGG
jgi:hypothetical protein